ncbi:MAG: hypothetical protein HY695_16485 [Deltaproteobacteria bacterium]|nr:hypothetical protein [Deltaproteobacteria bacterium]
MGESNPTFAKYGPAQPIVAVTPHLQTVRGLMLVWGVRPFLTEEFTSTDAMIKAATDLVRDKRSSRPR